MPKQYNVGYKRPPLESRFKKGQSGNPKGRPKERKTSASVVREILSDPITTKTAGVRVQLSPFEAALRQLSVRAVTQNDVKAAIAFLKICEEHGALSRDPSARTSGVLAVPADQWSRMKQRLEPARSSTSTTSRSAAAEDNGNGR